jgi:hypothetical protein
MTWQSCLLLVFFLGLPSMLFAQKQHGQWSDLNGLKAGQKIEVIDSKMHRWAGEFINVNDEMLTLQEGQNNVAVKREDVVRVSTSSTPKRGEHAVIGLVVGGLIGAAIFGAATSKSGWGGAGGAGALVGVGIGVPSGALVGAVLPAHTTVYRAAPAASH